jgi:hypothetical protein
MASDGMKEEWSLLTELLEKSVRAIAERRTGSAETALAECIRCCNEVGTPALCQAVETQAEFFRKHVLPDWDDEAATTLDFSMGALLEKMQLESPGAHFDAGLKEILAFLEQFEKELESAPQVNVAPQEQEAGE